VSGRPLFCRTCNDLLPQRIGRGRPPAYHSGCVVKARNARRRVDDAAAGGCGMCGNPVPEGRLAYCGPGCSDRAERARQVEYEARRAERRASGEDFGSGEVAYESAAEITAGMPFLARQWRQCRLERLVRVAAAAARHRAPSAPPDRPVRLRGLAA
jgi:hypothetical protein